MPITKQPISINFSRGLDTKNDPLQVPIGKFLDLENSVFTVGGRLTKRNGYEALSPLNSNATFLTTYNDNLTAIGSTIQAYSSSTDTWVDRGSLLPISLSTVPMIRSSTNQSTVDTTISSNGLVCCVYTDQTPTNTSVPRYMYAVIDGETGQNIVKPTVITATSGTVNGPPKVFSLVNYFVVVFPTSTDHLQYITISSSNTWVVTAAADLATSIVNNRGWDGLVIGTRLYYSFSSISGGQSIKISYLKGSLGSLPSPVTYSDSGKVTSDVMGMWSDLTDPSNALIWVSYFNSVTSTGYCVCVDTNLNKYLPTPVEIVTTGIVTNITGTAQGGPGLSVSSTILERSLSYGYDASLPTNTVSSISCTASGGSLGVTGYAGLEVVTLRSVGLGSKATLVSNIPYFLVTFDSGYQPTYFLSDGYGNISARLAYSNGGGYYTIGALPSVTIKDNTLYVAYLCKDFIASANASQQLSVTKSGIYSQTGLNLAKLKVADVIRDGEIAHALHLSGGFLWEYDGYSPVEHNFFVWPEDIGATLYNSGGALGSLEYQYAAVYSWSDNIGNIHRSAPSIPLIVDMRPSNPSFVQPSYISFTGNLTQGSTTIVNVSSFTGLLVGQYLTDATTSGNIQANTYITAIDISGATLTINFPAVGPATGDTFHTSTTCHAVIHVPTLRLTYKTANPVKIEIYRWSTAQQAFYQVTTINSPLINNMGVDYVSFTDTQADNQIVGNNLLYTSGGVIENISAPSFNDLTLFDDRLWGIDAENTNLLWYSKQVIESTPVEMSDLFTMYIAPSVAAQGSTGQLKCLFPLDDKLVMFKPSAMYFLNGSGPDNTGANNQYSPPIFITSTVGCSNPRSIVAIDAGLLFQSDKGIWLLSRNGIQVTYVGAPVEKYTLDAKVNSAAVIPGTTQVRFTMDSGITLMYDYFYGEWGIHSGIPAVSSVVVQGIHNYLDKYGNVFKETPGQYLDNTNPVLMKFTTSWINLAGLQGFQRAYLLTVLGQYLYPHKLKVDFAYDYNSASQQQVIISPTNYNPPFGTGNSNAVYGQSTPYGGPMDQEQWKVHLKNQLCQSIQISVQEVADTTFGVVPGAGLTLSGFTVIGAFKKGYRPFGVVQSAG